MKVTTISAAVASLIVCASSAQAGEHHHYHHHYRHYRAVAEHYRHHHVAAHYRHHRAVVAREEFGGFIPYQSARNISADGDGLQSEGHDRRSEGYGRRPSAWCGWEMRQLVGNDPGAEYDLARNWAHWGHAGPAGVGAVVVWPHHVGKIVGQENGQWVIKSGNDGHALRTRPRSIAGAIAIRWG